MAFYLLTRTYFNDVNEGKNLNLKNPFYEWRQEKMKQN